MRSRPRLQAAAVAVLVGTTTLAVAGTDASRVAAAPAGFVDTAVASVASPTAVEALPGRRVVVAEQNSGRLRLIDTDTGALLPGSALDLDVCSGSERGLLGFTADPDVEATGRVYVYYTRFAAGAPGGCVNRVSAFSMSGDLIDPTSEQVLVDNISSVNGNHNAGDLEVGNDGFLYISVGDAGSDPRGDSGAGGSNDAAQDLSLLNGKILRVDRFTGAAAPGNPLNGAGTADCRLRGNTAATPTTSCREIYSWGLRNPYRFAFDPNTHETRFFINDVGQSAREEVSLGQAGANYGWPTREGQCPRGLQPPCAGPTGGLVDPITDYGRDLGTFITAGAFVPDGAWPVEYDGGYLFADGGSGRMWLRSADGSVDYETPFSTGHFGLADMTFVLEPDGYSLYYTLVGGEVRKITPVLTSAAPSGPQRFDALPSLLRVLDTRDLEPAAPIRGGTTRLIDVEAPAGATAALVNLTMIRPTGGGYLAAWTPRTPRPSTSIVNAPDATVVANSAIVPLDDEGQMLLHARTTTHAVVDVVGFFVPAAAAVAEGRFEAVTPTRLVDTREPSDDGNSFDRVALAADRDRVRLTVAGVGDVPASGVAAVVVSLTAIGGADSASSGFVTAHATGVDTPVASNVNVTGAFDVRANLAVVPLGTDGQIDVVLTRVAHLAVDVVGYVTDESAVDSTDGRFVLVAPAREVDTRIGQGGSAIAIGVPLLVDPSTVPASASAVAQNLTIAGSRGVGNIRAYPADLTDVPTVSNVNVTGVGQARAAMAITPLSDGAERIAAAGTGPIDVVVDVVGYFE